MSNVCQTGLNMGSATLLEVVQRAVQLHGSNACREGSGTGFIQEVVTLLRKRLKQWALTFRGGRFWCFPGHQTFDSAPIILCDHVQSVPKCALIAVHK